MLVETRGGVARCVHANVPVTAGGTAFQAPFTTKHLQISNQGNQIVRIYFTAEDAANDLNWIPLGPNGAGQDFFEGPVELGDNQDKLWLRSENGTQLVIFVWYQRRG